MKTGIADLPLHDGKCPSWLFEKMKKLSLLIFLAIERDYGVNEFLTRISNPFWFQAFGCVLGFDWHSSGLTTTVCGALKESLKHEHGLVVLGGKGKSALKTPEEIEKACNAFNLSSSKKEQLIYTSRIVAKVDNVLLQDGYNLYHHTFFLTEKGRWAVIQQGMNEKNHYARRYHWLDEKVKDDEEAFVNEPHYGICCDKKEEKVLNMTAKESKKVRETSVKIIKEMGFDKLRSFYEKTLKEKAYMKMPKQHFINIDDYKQVNNVDNFEPKNYEELVAMRNVGKKTIRALALLSELIYGEKACWEDPVKYSFAHGGKDGFPYPVDEIVYNESIEILKNAIEEAKIGNNEKVMAIKRLKNFLCKC
jgi:hypothetical protein